MAPGPPARRARRLLPPAQLRTIHVSGKIRHVTEAHRRRASAPELVAALVDGLGGRIREVRIDRIVEGAYAATVEVNGPLGTSLVDARASDALNLAVLAEAPVFAAADVLDDNERALADTTAQAQALRRAVELPPMTLSTGRPEAP